MIKRDLLLRPIKPALTIPEAVDAALAKCRHNPEMLREELICQLKHVLANKATLLTAYGNPVVEALGMTFYRSLGLPTLGELRKGKVSV